MNERYLKFLEDGAMNLNELDTIALLHSRWLEEMKWNKASPLENLAMISGKIGEAVNECRGTKPTKKLGGELADIVLRVCGMAEQNGINILWEVRKKMNKNFRRRTNRGRIK